MKKWLFFQSLEFAFRSFRSHIKILGLSSLAAIGVLMTVLLATMLSWGFLYVGILIKLFGYTFPTQQAIASGVPFWERIFVLMPILIVPVFIAIIISMGLHLGFKKLMLDIYDQKPVSVRTIFSCFGVLWKYVCANILYGLVVCVGMLLLVFPGIYWAIRFYLFPFFIIDKNVSITDSLRMSWRATKGSFWVIFFMITLFGSVGGPFRIIRVSLANPFLSFFITVLGGLTFLIANLSYAYLYRKLVSKQLSEQKV